MQNEYEDFLAGKAQLGGNHGFDPIWMPSFLFDFQASLVEWATRKGRAAIFADCGLGKTAMQLVWGENVVRKTGAPVLLRAEVKQALNVSDPASRNAANALGESVAAQLRAQGAH